MVKACPICGVRVINHCYHDDREEFSVVDEEYESFDDDVI